MAHDKTFKSYTDTWMFCGYRILLYKWERARVLATTDYERGVLDRMADKMRDEMAKETSYRNERNKPFTPVDPALIVAQTNGDRYAGPVLKGRFQVMESFISGSYYVADHALSDLLVRVNGTAGDVMRFPTQEAAEAWIESCPSDMGYATPAYIRVVIPPREKLDRPETDDMARPSKALKEAQAAAEEADAKIGARRGRPPVKMAAPTKVAAPAKPVKAEKPAKVAATNGHANGGSRGRAVSTSGTRASLVRALLREGKLSDEKIMERARTEFGKEPPANLVSYYRKVMIEAGELSA